MATFKIHEDLENLHRNVFKKMKYVDVPQSNIENNIHKIVVPEKRVILKPVENAEVKIDIKRVKLNSSKVCNKVDETVPLNESENNDPNINLERIEEICSQIPLEKCEQREDNKQGFHITLAQNLEYRKEVFRYLKDQEAILTSVVRPNYILKQTDLSWNSRSILIDWLSSVCEEYDYSDQTFHLGVSYIDRVLSQISVQRSKLQLVGASAMFVASKMEEIYPIDAREWSYLTGDAFTKRQVLKMEQIIIRLLKYNMQLPTINTFIEHLGVEHNLDKKTLHLAKYLSELVLLEGDHYLNYLPSKLAAASIVLARHLLSKHKLWPKNLKESSGYTLKQLSPVVQKQHKTFENSPLKEQKAIQNKYKSRKFNKVALIKPRALNLEDLEDED